MLGIDIGSLDAVVCGGYDPINEYAYAGFNSLRLIATGPVTPFCTGREGMKLGEGYACLVLEREDDALSRGAKPLARLAGFAETADAHHLTQPHPDGETYRGRPSADGAAVRARVTTRLPCRPRGRGGR